MCQRSIGAKAVEITYQCSARDTGKQTRNACRRLRRGGDRENEGLLRRLDNAAQTNMRIRSRRLRQFRSSSHPHGRQFIGGTRATIIAAVPPWARSQYGSSRRACLPNLAHVVPKQASSFVAQRQAPSPCPSATHQPIAPPATPPRMILAAITAGVPGTRSSRDAILECTWTAPFA